jgi:tetratricopeptide (TPR) repeat protein
MLIVKAVLGLSFIFVLGFSFKKLLEIVSPDAKARLSTELISSASESAFVEGNFDKAIDELSQAIRLDTSNVVAYVMRGRVYVNLKLYSEAIKDLNKAIAKGESNSEVYLYRAQIHFLMDDYASAFADYSQSIEYTPNTEAYAGKGEVYFQMNQLREAIACYTKAIELFPENHKAYFARSKAYSMQSMYENALSDVDEALKLEPSMEIYRKNREFIVSMMNSGTKNQDYRNQDF